MALSIAQELMCELAPFVERIELVGSARRGKPMVKDIEILYIPRLGSRPIPENLFGECCTFDMAAEKIEELCQYRVLGPRLGKSNTTVWGPQNKLARHVASGIPVDLFASDDERWWNMLVCRTGPAEFNMRVCMRARQLVSGEAPAGWKWHPYKSGFENVATGSITRIENEQHLFDFLGWQYLEPEQRV